MFLILHNHYGANKIFFKITQLHINIYIYMMCSFEQPSIVGDIFYKSIHNRQL